tara:strand:- start:1031 stop:1414 length:384 start_codon:yes stop_codon:yes gene_type:complete
MDFETIMKTKVLEAWQVLLMSKGTVNARLSNHDQPEHGEPRAWVELTAHHTGDGIQWYRLIFHNCRVIVRSFARVNHPEAPEWDFEGSFSMGWSRWDFDFALAGYEKAKSFIDKINAEEPWGDEPRG